MMAESGEEKLESLPNLFDDVLKIWEFLETTDEPSVSYTVQKKVITGMDSGSKAISMVNELCLFSDNESMEEITTNEIKYMLLPAFMGYFTTKKSSKDHLECVRQGKGYFTDFLRMCKSYNVVQSGINIDDEDKEKEDDKKVIPSSRGPPDLMKMMGQREEKIRRYKEQKETERKIKELEEAVKKENVDDEIKREYYTLLLKKWIAFAVDEFDSLNCEETMLEIRNQTLDSSPKEEESPKKENKEHKPFRPFIVTKDIIQKKVFGAGYPSLPTYTVEEFYEQRLKDGTFKIPEQDKNEGKRTNLQIIYLDLMMVGIKIPMGSLIEIYRLAAITEINSVASSFRLDLSRLTELDV